MKKLLKIVLFGALAAGLFAGSAKADPFSDFRNQLQAGTVAQGKALLNPFIADFGGLLGGTDFNSGRTLGFPGFDIGLAATLQAKPDATDLLLKKAEVTTFGLPLLKVSVALPILPVDVSVRGISYSDLSLVGGGVTYGLLKSGTLTKFIPDVSVSAFYDSISYKYFSGSHMSVDAEASFDIPIIKPFIGVGLDHTTLKIKDVSGFNGIDGTISKPRYTLGVRFSPLPLVYVYGAYSSLHSDAGYNAGAGVKF